MKRTAFGVVIVMSALLALGACAGRVAIGGAEPGGGGQEAGALEAGALQAGPLEAGALEAGALQAGPLEAGAHEGDTADAQISESSPDIASIAETVTLTADYDVGPGTDVILCEVFPNPFPRDVDIVSIEGTTDIARDLFLFSLPPGTGGQELTSSLTQCAYDPVGVQPFLFFSQQAHLTTTYPQPSMGYPIPAQNLLLMRVHYLNSGSQTVQADTTVSLSAAKPGVVTIPVGTIFLRTPQSPIAATADGGPAVLSNSSMPVASGYSIFASWSFATPADAEVRVTAQGTPFYDVTNPESFSPLLTQNPTIQIGPSQTLAWSCTYGSPVPPQAFGQCVYQGFYYSAGPT